MANEMREGTFDLNFSQFDSGASMNVQLFSPSRSLETRLQLCLKDNSDAVEVLTRPSIHKKDDVQWAKDDIPYQHYFEINLWTEDRVLAMINTNKQSEES